MFRVGQLLFVNLKYSHWSSLHCVCSNLQTILPNFLLLTAKSSSKKHINKKWELKLGSFSYYLCMSYPNDLKLDNNYTLKITFLIDRLDLHYFRLHFLSVFNLETSKDFMQIVFCC